MNLSPRETSIPMHQSEFYATRMTEEKATALARKLNFEEYMDDPCGSWHYEFKRLPDGNCFVAVYDGEDFLGYL